MVLDTTPKKSLGQHWLTDEEILDLIVSSISIDTSSDVLEIGPGLGHLTARILKRGARVTALEFDHELAIHLEEHLRGLGEAPDDRLVIREGDVRTFDLTTLPQGYKIIANIPYYLTSYLMRNLCDTVNKPSEAALLMQKEVAERIAYSDGKQSTLSTITQYYYEAHLGPIVTAEYFTPPPKVDSQVLVLQKRDTPRFEADTRKLHRLIKAAYSEKRKNLRNALSGGLALDKQIIEDRLKAAEIAHTLRAEALTWEQWERMYRQFADLIA